MTPTPTPTLITPLDPADPAWMAAVAYGQIPAERARDFAWGAGGSPLRQEDYDRVRAIVLARTGRTRLMGQTLEYLLDYCQEGYGAGPEM